MSKFKVGDRVMVIGTISGTVIDVKSNGVVVECDEPSKGVEICQYPNKMVLWPNESQVELIAPSRYELHITCNDGKTTNAVYKVNGKIEKRTQTVCNPSDTFNFGEGAQLALNRMFPPKAIAQPTPCVAEDKPKYAVGDKVRFAKSKYGFKSGFIGKTYEIKNLLGKDNDGYIYGIGEMYVADENELEPYAEPVPFDWDAFKAGKIAVHCDTEEKAKAFIAECHANKISWPYSKDGTTHWDSFDSEIYYAVTCGTLGYSTSGNCYRTERFMLIDYPFTAEPEPEQPKEPIKLYCVKDYKALLSPMFTRGKIYETDENEQIKADSGLTTYRKWNSDKMKKEFSEMFASLIPLVKRPAKLGEYVLIVSDGMWLGKKYKTGEVYPINHIDSMNTDRCYFNFCKPDELFFKSSEYLVLDNYRPEPEKEPEPVYYNGIVKCTKGGLYHTQGMLYEVRCGIVNDIENKFDYNDERPCKSIAELNERNEPQFIPYLGEA